jgi:preprotein translocase subunit SecF
MSTEVVTAPTTHVRRSAWGRLYHGETSIDFYGKRWIGLGISAVLIVVAIASLLFKGLNLGIDFEGGVAWEVPSATLTIDEARSVLDANGIESVNAKLQERDNQSGRVLFVQVGDQPPEVQAAVQQAFADRVGVPRDEVSSTSVSATWGKSITNKAIRALVIFLVLVAVFIAWRLEWKMAVAAIVAMLHDVLISVGIYSLFGFELTPATVVAFLTILGFSLYDTIVVFDKVRENTLRYSGSRVAYADVLNVSMNQVLMRSLNTSLAAVLPVLSLLVVGSGILGAVTLREFSLALLVGLVTGSYSSVFVASPLLALFKEREARYRPQRQTHATGPELERLVLGGLPSQRSARRTAIAAADDRGAISAASADELLTHAPRPRKKKRRLS